MDRVYRMLKESRRMSAAAAGVVVKDGDDETGKGKAAGGAQGLTQDEKAKRRKAKELFDEGEGRRVYACSHGQVQGRGRGTETHPGREDVPAGGRTSCDD